MKAYGRDITELARNGKLDPVIGRAKEIERVLQILCRRTKNNAVLIGEAGVGKTAIVEGLSQRIVNGEVPALLADRKVVALDLTLLVAGTKFRGQFEERMKAVLEELRKANGKVIRVLLELHIGAEETKGGFKEEEVLDILFRADKYKNICFCGLMGMATHTDCVDDIHADFARIADFKAYLDDLFPELTDFRELSIGMSGDWRIALEHGATIVRIGTAIFGERQY